jgi:hypothetical protein
MLREQAEREAERRNREDPERARFEFYAFDQSAGLAEDAWDVNVRLRTAARTPAPEPAYVAEPAARAEDPPAVAWEEEAPPAPRRAPRRALKLPSLPRPRRRERPDAEDEVGIPTRVRERPARRGRGARRSGSAGLREQPDPGGEDAGRAGLLVRGVGAAVMLMGMLWMAMVVALAVILKPDDLTSFAVYLGGAVLGLLAILLGVVIRRS